MKWKHFLYIFEEKTLVRISARKKPSIESLPRSGTWVLYEWKEGKFQMPCFPEVTWPVIDKKMVYIGQLKNK